MPSPTTNPNPAASDVADGTSELLSSGAADSNAEADEGGDDSTSDKAGDTGDGNDGGTSQN